MNLDIARADLPAQPLPAFADLRRELLALIEGLSSAQWTDYNTHDPGITLGETLAWGLTEDCYTAQHPMADHMTVAEGQTPPPHADFAAARVLPSRACTPLDFRKLIIDVPGVRNAWIRETTDPAAGLWHDARARTLLHDPPVPADATPVVLHGFQDVAVAFEEDVPEAEFAARLDGIRGLLEANRNLGEIFLSVRAARPEEVAVCAEIIVSPEADLAQVMAGIVARLEEFIAPAPRFHSLADRLASGMPAEEILEGPLLTHGFLDDAEVDDADLPEDVRASDLIQVIMDVPGVEAVARLVMSAFRDGAQAGATQPWVLPLDPARAPELSLARSRFTFFKRNLPFHVAAAEYTRILDALRAERRFRRYPAGSQAVAAPAGRHRQLEEFITLLNQLPLNYGVGPAGLPDDAEPLRLAQAAQLKGYFLLAERLLAGHRAQVASLRDVLSLRRAAPVVHAAAPTRLRGFADLLATTELEFAAAQQGMTEDTPRRLRRRHRIVDHLLARFAESFDALAVAASRRPLGDTASSSYESKARWLGALPELAHGRGAAVNLALPPAAPESRGALSGLEARLRALLGSQRALPDGALVFAGGAGEHGFALRDPGAGDLAVAATLHATELDARIAAEAAVRAAPLPGRYRIEAEGGGWRFVLVDECGETVAFGASVAADQPGALAAVEACVAFFSALPDDPPLYVLEHIHLRPLHAGAELLPACECEPGADPGCFGDDPYSFRATLVLPASPARFRHLHYRAHLETIARLFTPAHVFLKICWLDDAAMAAFSAALLAWRRAHAGFLTGAGPDPAAERDALVRVWRDMRSAFPVATLHDCVDGNDGNPVVLDHNSLGTLITEDNP